MNLDCGCVQARMLLLPRQLVYDFIVAACVARGACVRVSRHAPAPCGRGYVHSGHMSDSHAPHLRMIPIQVMKLCVCVE